MSSQEKAGRYNAGEFLTAILPKYAAAADDDFDDLWSNYAVEATGMIAEDVDWSLQMLSGC